MSRKSKGSNAERELIHMLWERKWACVRAAGSGSTRFPSPDIIASNGIRRVAIECKATKDNKKYFRGEEIEDLRKFAGSFGSEAWVAIRFDKDKWYFLNTEDLKKTNKGYSIKLEEVKLKGLLFEELLGEFKQERL